MTVSTAADSPTSVRVLRAGLQTTVQDLGRSHLQHLGVPVSGAMDRVSAELANCLVGNSAGEAVLEMTLRGDDLEFAEPALIAVSGARLQAEFTDSEGVVCELPLNRPVLLPSGGRLSFGSVIQGCRSFLAVAGGFAVPLVMGSRATLLRSEIGGHLGRALRNGDVLPIGSWSTDHHRIAGALSRLRKRGLSVFAPSWSVCPVPLPSRTMRTLRIVPGRHVEWLSSDARTLLTGRDWRISSRSDRMGFRLEATERLEISGPELLSAGTCCGMLQVPPDGVPILLMSDCAPTGGYPCVAHVIQADLGTAAQLQPGERVRFEEVTVSSARESLRRQRSDLQRAITMARCQLNSGGAG